MMESSEQLPNDSLDSDASSIEVIVISDEEGTNHERIKLLDENYDQANEEIVQFIDNVPVLILNNSQRIPLSEDNLTFAHNSHNQMIVLFSDTERPSVLDILSQGFSVDSCNYASLVTRNSNCLYRDKNKTTFKQEHDGLNNIPCSSEDIIQIEKTTELVFFPHKTEILSFNDNLELLQMTGCIIPMTATSILYKKKETRTCEESVIDSQTNSDSYSNKMEDIASVVMEENNNSLLEHLASAVELSSPTMRENLSMPPRDDDLKNSVSFNQSQNLDSKTFYPSKKYKNEMDYTNSEGTCFESQSVSSFKDNSKLKGSFFSHNRQLKDHNLHLSKKMKSVDTIKVKGIDLYDFETNSSNLDSELSDNSSLDRQLCNSVNPDEEADTTEDNTDSSKLNENLTDSKTYCGNFEFESKENVFFSNIYASDKLTVKIPQRTYSHKKKTYDFDQNIGLFCDFSDSEQDSTPKTISLDDEKKLVMIGEFGPADEDGYVDLLGAIRNYFPSSCPVDESVISLGPETSGETFEEIPDFDMYCDGTYLIDPPFKPSCIKKTERDGLNEQTIVQYCCSDCNFVSSKVNNLIAHLKYCHFKPSCNKKDSNS